MILENASQVPKIFYGLHMAEGVAEYREDGEAPFRICIFENAIKKMDSTFPGKPVFVLHAEDDLKDILADIQTRADGYVIESFFNQADGKHWAKFIVVSDKGHKAIQNGWKLSNAYIPKTIPKIGQWHGVDYQKEVVDGEYDHLAIVPNPRYEESVIMTPDEFKAYNANKIEELKKIANSKETQKGDISMKLNFFKKAKVEKLENGAEISELSVTLPQSKKEVTIAEAITLADKLENMAGYANMEHMVKIGEEEMSVNELMSKYSTMCNEVSELKKNREDEADVDAKEDEEMENAEDEADKDAKKDEKKEEKKENAIAEAKEKAALKKKNFDALKNAHAKAQTEEKVLLLSNDRVELGRSKYGSSK